MVNRDKVEDVSEKPAFASFVASATVSTEFAVSIPAEIALYEAIASSSTPSAVSFESDFIC